MKASFLVDVLEAIISIHGDIEVCIKDNSYHSKVNEYKNVKFVFVERKNPEGPNMFEDKCVIIK